MGHSPGRVAHRRVTDAFVMETLCLYDSTVKDRYRYAIMKVIHLILGFLAALIGSAVATGTGFGAATILTPVLAFFIDLRQAICVVAIAGIALVGEGLHGAFSI